MQIVIYATYPIEARGKTIAICDDIDVAQEYLRNGFFLAMRILPQSAFSNAPILSSILTNT